MSAQSLLDQLLRQGLSLLQGQGQAPLPAPRQEGPPQGSAGGGKPQPGPDWGTFGAGAATGAAATGALGLLLGSKQARRYAGKAVKYGGVAAIGLMAYKAYTQWQAQQSPQAQSPQQPQPVPPTGAHRPAALPAPRTVDRLSGTDAEAHSQAMFSAMIAAAKADGHLDPRERGLLDAELTRLAADHALRQWLDAELQRPLDPAQVARAAQGDAGLAAEMYLASLLVADEQSFMERAYLDELARQLGLPAELKARLEAQAAA
jgi:uncharacterized membrane protein YebE (DUF533 family)